MSIINDQATLVPGGMLPRYEWTLKFISGFGQKKGAKIKLEMIQAASGEKLTLFEGQLDSDGQLLRLSLPPAVYVKPGDVVTFRSDDPLAQITIEGVRQGS